MNKGIIHKLNDLVIAQIAAGEVIESPVGLLKELIENSIDAQSSRISIFIRDHGFESIQIRDNGCGIYKEDLKLALESYATSKLSSIKDVYQLNSMGFRGEALSSIRSVSKISIESKPIDQEEAWSISGEQDLLSELEPCALQDGTRIIVKDLFFNAPIRREFYSNKKTLKKNFYDLITNFALMHYEIGFDFNYEDDPALLYPACDNLQKRIKQIFGNEMASSVLPVYFEKDGMTLKGYISSYDFYKSNASFIKFYVNKRIVNYTKLVGMFRSVYGELMPPGRFPIAFITLYIEPDQIDVNVHPQKREVRFQNENKVLDFIRSAIRSTIERRGPFHIKHLHHPKKNILNSSNATESIQNAEQSSFDDLINLSEDNNLPESLEEKEKLIAGIDRQLINFKAQKYSHAKLYDTFILASNQDGVYLIDQHTAHERINYEKFLKKLEQRSDLKQIISPKQIHLSPGEASIVANNLQLLESLGFSVEDLGPAGWQLTSVPFYLKSGEEDKAWAISLKLIEDEKDISALELFDELAKSLACRNAIKKGDPESMANLDEIINQLNDCETPGRCPHGRPTMVFLGKTELFALFKRFI